MNNWKLLWNLFANTFFNALPLIIMALLIMVFIDMARAQETPTFTHTWTEGEGIVSIPATNLPNYGETGARIEINWTPRIIHTTGTSQQIFQIPNHLGVWVWNDGIHGEWFNAAGERRLFRTRWGLPAPGVEIKITITWHVDYGYAVLVNDVLRIHDWQTMPTTVFPDVDITTGVYGGRIGGGSLLTGNFTVSLFDRRLDIDPCSVDVVGTINENVPLDNTGDWSQGIDPACESPTDSPPDPPDMADPIGEVILSWLLPTLNEDGTAIPTIGDAALLSTTIEYSICIDGSVGDTRLSVDVPMPDTTWQGSIITPGDWCFQAYVTNVGGISSAPSNIATKTILPAELFLSVSETTAYVLVKQINRLLLVVIGTVPLNTPCDGTQPVLGKHIVDRDLVQYTIPDHPDEFVVVAECAMQ